jgi:predicted ABC-type ATPase
VPVLTVFAGPNGSGKSSLIRQVEFEGRENLLEPMRLLSASNRNIRAGPESQQEAKFFVGQRSTFEAGRALPSKPHWPESGQTPR